MICNAIDEVLFWDELDVLKDFYAKSTALIFPHDPKGATKFYMVSTKDTESIIFGVLFGFYQEPISDERGLYCSLRTLRRGRRSALDRG